MEIDLEKIVSYIKALSGEKASREKALRIGAWGGVPALLILFFALALNGYFSAKKMAAIKKEQLKNFTALRSEYVQKKAAVDELSRKTAPGEETSPVSIIENIGRGIGIRDRMTSLKPLDEKTVLGYADKEAEVRISGIDLNQLVNFIYQTENGRYLLVTREFSLKSRFDNPDLLDIRMRISFITSTAG